MLGLDPTPSRSPIMVPRAVRIVAVVLALTLGRYGGAWEHRTHLSLHQGPADPPAGYELL